MTKKEQAVRRKMKRKLDILERDGPFCYWCERRTDIYAPRSHPLYCTLEHVLARSQGGTNSPDNLRIACRECNNQKDSWAPTPWFKVKEKLDRLNNRQTQVTPVIKSGVPYETFAKQPIPEGCVRK